jgi:hypothetical protein
MSTLGHTLPVRRWTYCCKRGYNYHFELLKLEDSSRGLDLWAAYCFLGRDVGSLPSEG